MPMAAISSTLAGFCFLTFRLPKKLARAAGKRDSHCHPSPPAHPQPSRGVLAHAIHAGGRPAREPCPPCQPGGGKAAAERADRAALFAPSSYHEYHPAATTMTTIGGHLSAWDRGPRHSARVHPGPDGRLLYPADEQGDVIPDFSTVGYKGGGVPLPTVPGARKLFSECLNQMSPKRKCPSVYVNFLNGPKLKS